MNLINIHLFVSLLLLLPFPSVLSTPTPIQSNSVGAYQTTPWISRSIYKDPESNNKGGFQSAPKGIRISPQACPPTSTQFKGQCIPLLQQYPCEDGSWMVDNGAGLGRCARNNCSGLFKHVYFQGACVPLGSDSPAVCPLGMKLYVHKTGVAECDCKEGFLYNVRDDRCYEAYRQGPCGEAQVLGIKEDKKDIGCLENPCGLDGFWCAATNTAKCTPQKISFGFGSALPVACRQFGSPCSTSEGGEGKFIIDSETNRPSCQAVSDGAGSIDIRIIGNVPIFKCSPGSRRDILGNCRTPITIDFS